MAIKTWMEAIQQVSILWKKQKLQYESIFAEDMENFAEELLNKGLK